MDADVALYKEAPEKIRARFAEITAMDRAIGQLRSYLRRERLAGNTLLWYCGDNGTPPEARLNMLFRGAKGSIYDGGLRVPGIVEWPDVIRKPRMTDINAVTSDILPTLCAVVDAPLPARPLDGIDLRPALEGRLRERPGPICFWHYDPSRERNEEPYLPAEVQRGTTPTTQQANIAFNNRRHSRARTSDFGGAAAILEGRHKLVEPQGKALELYDVIADPGETNDIAATGAATVKRMEGQLRDWQRSVEISLTGADYRQTAT